MHQQLLIRIALQLGLGVQSFGPCLLHDLRAGPRLGFVERVDGAEVDLFVDVVLERRGQVIRVIVRRALGVVVAVMAAFVVAVRHAGYGGRSVYAGQQRVWQGDSHCRCFGWEEVSEVEFKEEGMWGTSCSERAT